MNYPRVTEIISYFTHYSQVPAPILKRAAERGTSVHALCAGIAKGNWMPESMIPEEYKNYVKSFQLWAEAQVDKFIVVEKRYFDDELKYSGQLDFVVLGKDSELYLVDIKTSATKQKTYPIQMAAYDALLKAHKVTVKAAMIVYLSKDGDFPNITYLDDMTNEWHVFSAALTCWNYFNPGKRNAGKKTA